MFPIIGLTGKAGSGKDTAAKYIIEAGYPVTRIAFADQLKRFAATVLDLDPAVFFETSRKEEMNAQLGKTHRHILIEFGTKLREIDPAIWIHWADRDVRQLAQRQRGAIFTDVRYRNEGFYIRRLGGYVVEIERPGTVHPDVNIRSHPSENYDGHVDATIINQGSLDQFRTQIITLVESRYGPPS